MQFFPCTMQRVEDVTKMLENFQYVFYHKKNIFVKYLECIIIKFL